MASRKTVSREMAGRDKASRNMTSECTVGSWAMVSVMSVSRLHWSVPVL